MSVKRRYQIFAAEEAQAGEAVSGLLAVANANFLVIDPSMEFNPELFQRANINRASLSPLPSLAGVVTGTSRFGLELAGAGTSGGNVVDPPWSVLLKACGMHKVEHVAATIGAVTSGPFFHGETVTGGTSSATGKVIHDTYNGAATMYIESLTGTFTSGGETLTGGTSAASATASAIDVNGGAGFSFFPTSDEFVTMTVGAITGTIAQGDVLVGGTSGAVGVATAAWSGGGAEVIRTLDGIFQASETLTNVTQSGSVAISGTPAFAMSKGPSVSLGLIEDGVAKQMKGARGTFAISGETGQGPLFQFEFQGLKNGDPTDAGALSGVTYTTRTPPALLGYTFVVGDDAVTAQSAQHQPRIGSFNFDLANGLGIPRDGSEATGVYDSAHIISRASSGSMDVKVAPENSFDFVKKLIDGTPVHNRTVIGSTSGNQFLASAPGLVYTSETGGEDQGFGTRQLAFDMSARRPDGTESEDAEFVLSII